MTTITAASGKKINIDSNRELADHVIDINSALRGAAFDLAQLYPLIATRVSAAKDVARKTHPFCVDDPDHWVNAISEKTQITGLGGVYVMECEKSRGNLFRSYRIEINLDFWYMTAEQLADLLWQQN